MNAILLFGSSPENEKRVLRGGSWINNARNARSAYRNANDPGNANDNIGFRLSRALQVASRQRADQVVIPSARPLQRKGKVDRVLVAAFHGERSRIESVFTSDHRFPQA